MTRAKDLTSQDTHQPLRQRPPFESSGWLWLITAGFLLMQAAWVMAIPAFRAIDEFDHVHRAASVADGQWAPSTVPAEAGRGRLVTSTRALVDAAQEQCESYIYTRPDNCRSVREIGNGRVIIASAATDQPPAVYGLVGYPAMLTDGTASLYVMRVCASVVCALMIGLAVWALRQWANGSWPMMALFAATTPVTVYSTMVPSGNGLEIVCGIALWCTLLGLNVAKRFETQRLLLLASAPPLAFLCGLRQLGPIMAFGIVLIMGFLLGGHRLLALYRNHRGPIAWLGAVAVVATASQALWVATASNYPSGPTDPTYAAQEPPGTTSFARFTLQWLLQSFAAFPTRTEPAPPVVYAVLLLTSIALVTVAFYRGQGRLRVALVSAIAVSVLLPVVFTLTYWDPVKWQGRYGLALSAGCFLIAGQILDAKSRPSTAWVMLWTLAIGAMHVVSVVGVDRYTGPPVGIALPSVLMASGWFLAAVATAQHYRSSRQVAEPDLASP